jgi:hypothetical protein
MLEALNEGNLHDLRKLSYEFHSSELPNFRLSLVYFLQHRFQNWHFRVWGEYHVIIHLLGLFSKWLGSSHKDKFALSPVWLNKLHEALVIYDIIKVRVDATVFVQVLKSVIV